MNAPLPIHLARIALALLLTSLVQIRAELIPAARLVDWTPGVSTGVPGGIPTDRTRRLDVTSSPYLADRTGSRDATAAIQSAINAAVPGDIVFLPAGTYLCRGALSTGYKRGITIRGEGSATVLIATVGGSTFLQIGGGSDYTWSWPPSGNVVNKVRGQCSQPCQHRQ